MNITSLGDGEPIVFIHGLVGNQQVFKNEVNYLKKHFRTIAYDYLGHGTDRGSEVEFTIENLVAQLFQVYVHENIDQAHICSLSFGCYIAHAFADKYPHKVTSICNIGGHYNNPSFLYEQYQLSYEEPINNYLQWLANYADRVKLDNKQMPNPFNRKSKEIFMKYGSLMHPKVIKQSLKIRLQYDLKSVLKRYNKPVLWISGEYDYLYRTCTYDLFDIIPHVKYIEVSDAGHLVHLNQSDIFLYEYKQFLDSL